MLSALTWLTAASSSAVVLMLTAAAGLITVADGGGYMGLGLLFAPVAAVAAAGLLLVVAVWSAWNAVRQGQAWFVQAEQ